MGFLPHSCGKHRRHATELLVVTSFTQASFSTTGSHAAVGLQDLRRSFGEVLALRHSSWDGSDVLLVPGEAAPEDSSKNFVLLRKHNKGSEVMK